MAEGQQAPALVPSRAAARARRVDAADASHSGVRRPHEPARRYSTARTRTRTLCRRALPAGFAPATTFMVTSFRCATCGAKLTAELAHLPSLPATSADVTREDGRRASSTVPRGHFGIEPEPWGAPYVPHPDQEHGGVAQRRGSMYVCD